MKTMALLAAGALVALSGCASVISQGLRAQAVSPRGLSEVQARPDAFAGQTVILGGEIIEARNRADGTTLLVLDKPLGARDEPGTGDQSDGRFMVEVPRYLDPVLFARGRAVTVAGTVAGVKNELVGQAPYAYVVLEGQEVYLWQRTVDPYHYGYPYGYDPFWGPRLRWWGPRLDHRDRPGDRTHGGTGATPEPSRGGEVAPGAAEHR